MSITRKFIERILYTLLKFTKCLIHCFGDDRYFVLIISSLLQIVIIFSVNDYIVSKIATSFCSRKKKGHLLLQM